ncbi:hypothetical protein [Pseudomonas putida]|uniref:hypothetical protein n=1 Tax=Pseudomonas putida TaxID=303 RepID=UPI0037F56664
MFKFSIALKPHEVYEGVDLRSRWSVNPPAVRNLALPAAEICAGCAWLLWCAIGEVHEIFGTGTIMLTLFWASVAVAFYRVVIGIRVWASHGRTVELQRQAKNLNWWLTQGSYDHISNESDLKNGIKSHPLSQIQVTAAQGYLDADSMPVLMVFGVARDNHLHIDATGQVTAHRAIAVDYIVGYMVEGAWTADAMSFTRNQTIISRLSEAFGRVSADLIYSSTLNKASSVI